jgi:uncharacterized membrane protein
MNEENSFSIINRTNGQITGEKANALPIKVVTNFSWIKVFALGFVTALVLMVLFVITIKRQVVVVDVAGQSTDYKEYQLAK